MKMLRVSAALVTAGLWCCRPAAAQIAGTWQGTVDGASGKVRIVLQIRKDDSGAWQAVYSSNYRPPGGVQDPGERFPATGVLLSGSSLRMAFDLIGTRYAGTVSNGGNRIRGEWTTQGSTLPLDLQRVASGTAGLLDQASHKIQFVTVDRGVKLEVLDWGGTGRPVILLAGLGNTAHVYDPFATKLSKWYHVYGITRRGFGTSSWPAPGYPDTGYSVDRLGDDIVAVMDALKIDRPVLIGHSLGGEELSDVGSRYPEKIAGLVYLDAASAYSFYDASGTTMAGAGFVLGATSDADVLRDRLAQLPLMLITGTRQEDEVMIKELLDTDLPLFRRDLETWQRNLPPDGATAMAVPRPYRSPIYQAMLGGQGRFTSVKTPILAIFADPHADPNVARQTAAQVAAWDARDKAFAEAQIAVVERDAPQVHIVRLPHADHYVFVSNEADVLNDVHEFIQALPPR